MFVITVQIHQLSTFCSKCFIIHFVNKCLCVYICKYTYRHICYFHGLIWELHWIYHNPLGLITFLVQDPYTENKTLLREHFLKPKKLEKYTVFINTLVWISEE